jgi:thiol-disulfide isomerase/thioredoxin
MRQILFLLAVTLLISCGKKEKINVAKVITIAGKVINHDVNSGKNILTIYINDNGRATQLNYATKLDSLGSFNVKFERYYPQDVMISYLTNFQVIVHPGDSLYVEFYGNTRQRTEILETVKYAGDAALLNTQLSKYLKTYFETRPSSSFIHQNERLLNPNDYKKFQDSIKVARDIHRDQFIKKNNPSQELKNWINSDIQFSYYEQLLEYPDLHRKFNNLPREWRIEANYYDFIYNIKPLYLDDLIYSDSRWFINRFLNEYVWDIAWNNADSISKKNADSLIFNQIIELSPQKGLIVQLTLNEFINNGLSKYETKFYEKNETLINTLIKENYLIEPIHNYYKEVKKLLDKPVLAAEIEVNENNEKSASDIWQKILNENKGKVIYIDCWATWCGACISEFPNSNKMMEEYKGKNLVFVYLCLKSEEKQWKTVLSDKKMKGKHFFLNDEQSAYFEKILKINGYPTYAIIDKQGQIIRSGNMFRPSQDDTEKIINELL